LGPTASGKTALALSLFRSGGFCGIVNADASQVYRQVSVGVASPCEQELAIAPHYLYSFLDCKIRTFNAAQYRSMVEDLFDQLAPDDVPLFCGGSLFYVKSLFFRLQDSLPVHDKKKVERPIGFTDWEYLNLIDPVRSASIHPHDSYRIERALTIYNSSGVLPSSVSPVFDPVFKEKVRIIWVDLPDELLRKKISMRIASMLDNGWVTEVENLIGSEFESFARDEGALGYQDVYRWIVDGKQENMREQLIQTLEKKTWDYVRRQRKFWRSFKRTLEIYPEMVELVNK